MEGGEGHHEFREIYLSSEGVIYLGDCLALW
jgi:hypothetical protein